MKYEPTTPLKPQNVIITIMYFMYKLIRFKMDEVAPNLRLFHVKELANIINANQRKQTAPSSRIAKFPKENTPSYTVSERNGDGAKQKRGSRLHWWRRWADSRIIWRKYYRGGIQGAPGGRGATREPPGG